MSRGGHRVVTKGVTGTAPPQAYNGGMQPRRPIHIAPTLVVAILAAMLLAACGGGTKPPKSPGSGQASRNSPGQAAYRYSACMRTHGVANFQDPHVSVHGNQVSVAIHVDPAITSSPAFKSAQTACAHILPGAANGPTPAQQHMREQAMLAFANCMRQHGFTRFPDPTAQGQLSPQMVEQAGINLQAPAVKPAAYACAPLTHGLLTKADINQAIANPNGSGSQGSPAQSSSASPGGGG